MRPGHSQSPSMDLAGHCTPPAIGCTPGGRVGRQRWDRICDPESENGYGGGLHHHMIPVFASAVPSLRGLGQCKCSLQLPNPESARPGSRTGPGPPSRPRRGRRSLVGGSRGLASRRPPSNYPETWVRFLGLSCNCYACFLCAEREWGRSVCQCTSTKLRSAQWSLSCQGSMDRDPQRSQYNREMSFSCAQSLENTSISELE